MQTTDSLIPLRHFPRSVVLLLVEAVRRHYMRPEEPLETRWVGLGYLTTYRAGVAAGLFAPVHRETPRVLGWYRLTPNGAELVRRMLGVLSPEDFQHFDLCPSGWEKLGL